MPKFKHTIVIFLILCLGLLTLGIGAISNMPTSVHISSEKIGYLILPYINSIIHFASILCAAIVVIELTRVTFKLNYLQSFLGLVALGLVVAGFSEALFAVVFFVMSSILCGRNILRILSKTQEQGLSVFSFLAGAGVFGTVVSLLVHLPFNNTVTYTVILGLSFCFFNSDLKLIAKECFHSHRKKTEPFNLVRALLYATCLFYVSLSVYPEVGYDALAVHLFIPEFVSSNSYWNFDPNLYAFAFMPLLADWMYTIVFVLGGEVAARLLNIVFLFVVCLNLRTIVKVCGGNSKVADFALILFLFTPLVMLETQSLFVENIFASYVTAATILVAQYFRKKVGFDTTSLYLAVAIGFSLAIKAVTLIILPIFGLAILFRVRTIYRALAWSTIVKSLIVLLAIGIIPYARAFIVTGNPVFPFYNSIFESPFYPIVNFDNPLFKSGLSWRLIYDITFNSSSYLEARNGVVGVQWLAIAPASFVFLVMQKNKIGLLFLFFGLGMMCLVFQFQSYLRYIYPSFAILCATSVLIFSEHKKIGKHLSNVLKIVLFGCLVVNASILYQHVYFYKVTPLVKIINPSERDKFHKNFIPIRVAVDIVNKINFAQKPVVVLGAPMVSGLKSDAVHSAWYNTSFAIKLNNIKTTADFRSLMSQNDSDLMLLEDAWGNSEHRKIIEGSSEEIVRISHISIRRMVTD